ncbi:hypothetical protein [Paenibacillus contaminans]|uniref:Uncharacterized protein n=1 Tax=Paenibacillus contaminans TaxID=450362 RepID=A0A329MIG5_9BACL|nr:hypothetical protein [Paenibacillus contaminans]RAV19452.1 hypothetical protein DQG23_20900 [Paenibacillus contaminans]
MKILKWLLAIIFFHPVMISVIILTLMIPFMIYGDIKGILIHEVPVSEGSLIMLSFCGFFVYLALRSSFLGIPYRKITILLPMLQMVIYTSLALAAAFMIINKWADQGLYSKGWAITLALLAIVVIRLLMSLLYWKYPIVQRKGEH